MHIRNSLRSGFSWALIAAVTLASVSTADAGSRRHGKRSAVSTGNYAPTIEGTPSTRASVGSLYFFQPAAADRDGDSLKFHIRSMPGWAAFNSSTGELTGTPAASDVGLYRRIRIYVSDGSNYAQLPSFDITIDPQAADAGIAPKQPNTAPEIHGNPPTSIQAGQSYVFTPVASDADGDTLTFSISHQPSWASFSFASGRLAGTPKETDAGAYADIRIGVSDGTGTVELAPFSIEVQGTPNRAPTLSGTPPTSVQTGEPYAFTPVATDADNDTLVFTVSNRPSWVSFNASTGGLSGSPRDADAGTYGDIRIAVSDGTESAELAPFSIEVRSTPNRAPTISGTPAASVQTGNSYAFTPAATDADGDTLNFKISNQPAWASFSFASGRLSGTPTDADVGSYNNIRISVSDAEASVELAPFSIEVKGAPNRVPTISGTPPTTVQAGQSYAFTPSAADADNDTLTFTVSNKPAWASFNSGTGRLRGTPTDADAGTYTNIRISVSDAESTAELAPFSIEVQGTPNRAPTISGTPPATVQAGQSYAFTPSAADADNDTLTFTVSNKPGWASFDSRTGQLSGTPGEADAGTFWDVVISVSDGKAEASLAAFSIDVTQNANGAVTLSWTPPTTNTDGTLLQGLNGYIISYGQASGQYTDRLTISNPGITSAVIENLAPATWYFAVRATTDKGAESDDSNEAVKTIR